jgi:hypothetical protein
MACTFIDTLCKYKTCVMRSMRQSSWCYWSAVDCDGRATVVEVGWRRCCLKDWWECCSSLGLARGACCSVKNDEAREWVDPAVIHLSLRRPTPVAGYIASYRTCHADTRTALLELNVLTGPRHLADSTELFYCFFTIYSRYLKRVISKRDGCEYLKQVPSIDGSLELI